MLSAASSLLDIDKEAGVQEIQKKTTPTPAITESESCDHFEFGIKISFNS